MIPNGWSNTVLSEGINLISGRHVVASGCNTDGSGMPYLTGPEDFPNGRIQATKFVSKPDVVCEPGDILLVVKGSGTGKMSRAEGRYCISRQLMAIRSSIWSNSFLEHFIRATEERFNSAASGLIPGISRIDILETPIMTPPIQEQRKIARILTTLDNLIEKTESVIAKYQAIKQGMMHDLFTRGVDAHGHLRPPQAEAPDLYKQSELGWIPKEWKTCRVDEVGSVKLGRQRSPKHQSGRFTTHYLRVANVFDGFIDYSDVLEMDFTPTEKDTYSLLPGDVLLNEGQSLELVGRSAIYDGEPYRFCFQNTLIRFRAYPPNEPRFCRGIFKFYIDIGRFMTIARQTTSVAHLGADRLAKLAFPCPEPDEQIRIAKALVQHEKQCELDRAYKVNLVQQKTGLMQDLLTGKVRVKVDEAEEVAANG